MREKRLHLCQVINSTFLEFGTLNEKEFNEAIKIALEVPLPFSKVGCVFSMVVVSILRHTIFVLNDHREYAPHFSVKCDTNPIFYLKVSEDVLEQDENRETIRAECNAMLKKGFYFQIEKIRDEDSIDKKFNYTFVCTNKFGFQIVDF